MNERRDDTTDSPPPPKPGPRREREPGSYYYDDATGYEIFDPESEAEGEEDEPSAGSAGKMPALPAQR